MSTLLFCIRQSFSNIRRNISFSLASAATVTACVFLFCIFFALILNIRSVTLDAENSIGITVFFDDDTDEAGKEAIRSSIEATGMAAEIRYISADEAWESFQADYFGEESAELSEAFGDDNPLADSDSFEVFTGEVEDQTVLSLLIAEMPGVREVSCANGLVSLLRKINQAAAVLAVFVTVILFLVSVFLIRNTITMAAAFRKRENEIMKLIGATNFMIRAPFVLEGVFLGTAGALTAVVLVSFIYIRTDIYLYGRIAAMMDPGILETVLRLLPLNEVLPGMAAAGLILGTGMGLLVSFFTIRKHLRV